MDQMVIYGAIAMTYLTVALAALMLLMRRKPVSKETISKVAHAAKDVAANTLKMAAMNLAPVAAHNEKMAQ